MKATTHTHHYSKLIADVYAPKVAEATNRRGNTMSAVSIPTLRHAAEHHCYEHSNSRTLPRLSLATFSMLPGALYQLKSTLPAWSPKKFTVNDGVKTNWVATLPPRQLLANVGLLSSLLVIAAFAVWTLPQNNPPHVLADTPTHRPQAAHQETPAQATLAATTTSDATSSTQQSTVWWLPTSRTRWTNSSSPVNGVASSMSVPYVSDTNAAQNGTTPQTDTPPSAGETAPVVPTDPPILPVDPPVDPPVEPPVIIIEPPILPL